VRTPAGCASGEWATAAAREVLEHQLRVHTVRGACGLLAPAAAAAEAARAGVASVVMASVDDVRFQQSYAGYRAIGRLRLVVVRDGQIALERAVQLAAPRLLASGDLASASRALIAEAFARFTGELSAALGDPR
jgi:hypothetical protein